MSLKGYKIFIDPGHGGNDPGAVYGNVQEKTLALDIGLKLRDRLNALGATTQMSRTGDTNPSLASRVSASNSFGADIFVSVHINSGGGTGVETWKHDNASSYTTNLATNVNNTLASRLGVTNRGVKSAPSGRGGQNIYVIDPKNIKAWAILPEILFIDNANDRAKLTNESQRTVAANAIADGISNFVAKLPPK